MSDGAWPFLPAQCPECRYFHAYEAGRVDDRGYALPGFCRHPRIAMELFRPGRRLDLGEGRCPLFTRQYTETRR